MLEKREDVRVFYRARFRFARPRTATMYGGAAWRGESRRKVWQTRRRTRSPAGVSWLGGISFPRRLPANATLPPYRGRRRRCRHRRRRRRRFVFLRSLLPVPVPVPASPPSSPPLSPPPTHFLLFSSQRLSPTTPRSPSAFSSPFPFPLPFVSQPPSTSGIRHSPLLPPPPSSSLLSPSVASTPPPQPPPCYFHQLLQRLLLFHWPEFLLQPAGVTPEQGRRSFLLNRSDENA